MPAIRPMVGVVCGLLLSGPAGAGYRDAAAAHLELAGLVDSVVVKGEATAAGHVTREEYFVMFRFEGLLWKYSPESGTRMCGAAPDLWPPPASVVLDRVREADPFLTAVSIYRHVSAPVVRKPVLPNACVPVCLLQMARLLKDAGMPDEVGLVFFFYDPLRPSRVLPPGSIGHCTLVYRYRDRWSCLDPRQQDSPKLLTQVAVGAHLDSTLQVLAERPDYQLKGARLLLISPRTLRQLDADLVWKLWAERTGEDSRGQGSSRPRILP